MPVPSRLATLALAFGLMLAVPAPAAEASSVAQPHQATIPSVGVVRSLYAVWQPYTLGTGPVPLKKVAPYLTPEFHAVLASAYDPPAGTDGAIIEWDPFTASQDSTAKVAVLAPKRFKGYDLVPVSLLGTGQTKLHTLELRVVSRGGRWLVDDVVVSEIKVTSTKKWLQDALAAAKPMP